MLINSPKSTFQGFLIFEELLTRSYYFSKCISSAVSVMFDGIIEKPELVFSGLANFRNKDHEELNGRKFVRPSACANSSHDILKFFSLKNNLGIKRTKFVICRVLNSCSKLLNWQLGLQIHAQVIRDGYSDNLFINSGLVDFYSKCGVLADARKVFDGMQVHDQVSWTSMISGLSQNGQANEAIFLFKEMLVTQIKPNCFTYASLISAASSLELAFECGMLLHAHVTKLGYECNSFIVSSLIDCFSKCGRIDLAILLFNASKERDSILLNSMISGYSQNLCGEQAIKLFKEMHKDSLSTTHHTFTSIFKACGTLAALGQGKQLHALVIKMGSSCNVFVIGALIDMYSKCGNIDEARGAFDEMTGKNSILWTSMIMGYAQIGKPENALELFENMILQGFKPDHICFTAILTACNNDGFLDKGIEYFNRMTEDYGVVPDQDHYACLIDLYARNGHLKTAKKLLEEMPFKPNSVMWSSFLSSCREYGEVELGKEAAYKLFNMAPCSPAPFLALANVYVGAGLWNEASEVKKLMNRKGIKKNSSWSWIEVDYRVHFFSVGDVSHPSSQEIYFELEKLKLEMKIYFTLPN